MKLEILEVNRYNLNMDINCINCGKIFNRPKAWIKKSKKHYCSSACFGLSKIGSKATIETRKKMSARHKGELNHAWKGGRYIGKDGYIHIRDIDNKKYIREHCLLMQKHIGRKLNIGEVVHHKNGVKTDNRIDNLQLLTISEHKKIHGNQYAPRNIHNSN